MFRNVLFRKVRIEVAVCCENEGGFVVGCREKWQGEKIVNCKQRINGKGNEAIKLIFFLI